MDNHFEQARGQLAARIARWTADGEQYTPPIAGMAVAHGTDKPRLLEHKAAIDAHLAARNIPVSYTNVFWGGRSEIKPSEISPMVYRDWLREMTPQAAWVKERRRFPG